MVKIENQLKNMEFVDPVHHLHNWSPDGERAVLAVHVATTKILDPEDHVRLKQRFRQTIDESDIYYSTLEIELPYKSCRIENNKT